MGLSQSPILDQHIQMYYQGGRTLKHRPEEMLFEIPKTAQKITLELALEQQIRPWHTIYRQPTVGMGASWLSYGNDDILGQALSIYPYINIPLISASRFTLSTAFQMGLSWNNRPFDRQTNPLNTGISLPINIHLGLDANMAFKLFPAWDLLFRASISHESNAKFHLPNLGLNSVLLGGGIRYIWKPPTPSSETIISPASYQLPRWTWAVSASLAYKENKVPNGPKYPLYVIAAFAQRRHADRGRLWLGAELSFDHSLEAFLRNQDIRSSSPDFVSNFTPWAPSLVVAYEVLWGRVAFLNQAYFQLNQFASPRDLWGLKLGPHIYLKHPYHNPKHNWMLGLYIKVNYFVADYAALALTYQY